jgi:hypothetical protein
MGGTGTAREGIGVTPYVPKPLTSGSKAKGRFGKQDFVADMAEQDHLVGAGEDRVCGLTKRTLSEIVLVAAPAEAEAPVTLAHGAWCHYRRRA